MKGNAATRPESGERTPINVLIVEDSETQASMLAEMLLSSGYRVLIAKNGREGLELARSWRPTLILSDIAMPEMDGFTLCSEIKKDSMILDVPVILLTSLTSLYDVLKALDCGADNFIRKPVEKNYLLTRIDHILANRASRGEERVQLGMRINLGGRTHFITAERQQIFDLLLSTYDDAIQLTEQLRIQQNELVRSYQSLEGIYRLVDALNPAVTEDAVLASALEQAIHLPAVVEAYIHKADHPAGLGMSTATASDASDRSVVSVPLIASGTQRGVLRLRCAEEQSDVAHDTQLYETVGVQIANALERADLYSNMESLVAERTRALESERRSLAMVVNTAAALIVMVDPLGRIEMFNPAAEVTLGWRQEEVRGRPVWDVIVQEDRAHELKQFFESRMDVATPLQRQGRYLTRDGDVRQIIWSISVLQEQDDAVENFLCTGLDVTELKNAEEKVQFLSNYDHLTGLPNRLLIREKSRSAMEHAAIMGGVLGFLVVGFGRLSNLRETLGGRHEQALIMEVARRLTTRVEGSSCVARVGDHAFAVITHAADLNELAAHARSIASLLDEPFLVEHHEVHLEPATGISVYPRDAKDFDTLLQGADAAMHRALVSDAERIEFYTDAIDQDIDIRFRMEAALRQALRRDELFLHYQPQVDLNSGAIVGLEALLRWQHPVLGLVPPNQFIGLAEETRLIVPIGEWVLRTACEQARAWQQAGCGHFRVAVNLSARQFSQKNLVAFVSDTLRETGLAPEWLDLELTESLVMHDVGSAIRTLRELRDLGIRISMDDFGTGYSSLAYLKQFPIDMLKIDRSFVNEITGDPADTTISQTIIAMAHTLGMKVIAEGVETEVQCRYLARNACDEIQGYLFSKPLTSQAVGKLLGERRSLPIHLRREPIGDAGLQT